MPSPVTSRRTTWPIQLLRLLAALLVLKTIGVVLLNFSGYFPPNFQSDFLLGRRPYFFGMYAVAFYVHIVSGPFTLIAGLVLLSQRFRSRWPVWHRWLGRTQVLCILAAVTPSGLWMSAYAATGRVAGAGFAVLSIATALCAAKGWSAAVGRRFDEHRRWMQRCYALLCSAIVLRLIGGVSDMLGAEGTYPYAAWLGWIGPLAALEGYRLAVSRPSSLRPRS